MSVCVSQWLIHWFHNTTWLDLCECWTSANTLWHQIRQTLAFPLRLLSISSHHFNFPFPPSCSSYTPSICCRPLTSPSTPALRFHFLLLDFIFSPVSLFSFFSPPPPLTQITDDPTCTCTKHTQAWKWLKAEMYTVHEPILGLNQHIHAVFFGWSMDRLGAWNENPLNRTFFTFPCILSQLGESLEFSKKMLCF